MQPYMNYYQPMYQQPNFNNPMMSAQQRMMQMEQQYPQFQQIQQIPAGLTGRIVDDFSTITANDIPMDGTGAIFVKRDNSEIQHKIWGSDGTIRTTYFKPDFGEKETETDKLSTEHEKLKIGLANDITTLIENQKNELVERMEKLEKLFTEKKGAK